MDDRQKLMIRVGRDDDEILVLTYPIVPRVPPSLTDSEADVLTRIMLGESNADIARNRDTSPNTIANQVSSIFEKLGVNARSELAWKVHRRCAACPAPTCEECECHG